MTKLLVAGGDELNSFEIVNLDDSNPFLVCDNIVNLPGDTFSEIAFLFNGSTPISCARRHLCYSYQNGVWNDGPECPSFSNFPIFSIITERKNSEDHEIVLLPGIEGNSAVQSFDGNRWSEGVYADLPVNISGHCMVRINDSMVMVIGGLKDSPPGNMAGDSYFFHASENKWILGPQLIITRWSPVCGVMSWKNNKVIVVTGGYELNQSDVPLKSVEFLFLNEYEHLNISWVEGPSLPHIIEKPVMVEFNNGIILVGGNENSKYTNSGHQLFQLSSPNGTWMRMSQQLKEKRPYSYQHSAFLVPDEMVNCHL
jgi:hypothetical protein